MKNKNNGHAHKSSTWWRNHGINWNGAKSENDEHDENDEIHENYWNEDNDAHDEKLCILRTC